MITYDKNKIDLISISYSIANPVQKRHHCSMYIRDCSFGIVLLVTLMLSSGSIVDEDIVNVTTKSIGCNSTCGQCSSFTMVNSEKFIISQPGLHIVAISNETGRITHNTSFHSLSMNRKREKLKTFLTDIPAFFVVIITVHHECIARISGWYDLLRQASALKLHPNQITNNENSKMRRSPAIIVTCQNDCPLGWYSEELPFYGYQQSHSFESVHSNLSIQFGSINQSATSSSSQEDKDNKKKEEKEEEDMDETLFIIILAVSIALVLILISLIITMIFCCKSAKASRQNAQQRNSINQPTSMTRSSSTTKIPGPFEKWLREKQIKDINKEIVRKSKQDNRAFKGDIVRGSVSTNTLSRDFHMLSSDYENAPDHKDPAQNSVARTTSAYSTCSLRSSKDGDEYLRPIDYLKTPKEIKIYSSFSSPKLSSSEPYENNSRSKSVEIPQVNEILDEHTSTSGSSSRSGSSIGDRLSAIDDNSDRRSDDYEEESGDSPSIYSNLYPSSSHQIFLSRPDIYTTLDDTDSSSRETDHATAGTDQKHKFAEYCQLNMNGPVYKKPSDVVRFDPPEYTPSEIPKIVPRADSIDKTISNYANLKECDHGTKETEEPFPEIGTSQCEYNELSVPFEPAPYSCLYELTSEV